MKLVKNRKQLIVLIALSLLLLIGIIYTAISKGNSKKEMEHYVVKNKDALIFDGQVRSDDTQEIFQNPTYGEIDAVLVRDGQTVQKGQSLIRFKNGEMKTQLEQSKRQRKRAKENYNAAVRDYERAVGRLNEHVDQYNETGTPPEMASQLDQEKDALSALKKAVREAEYAIEDANASIKTLEEKAFHIQKAMIDGKVQVDEKARYNPQSQSPIITVTSKRLVIVGELTEFDYDKIQKNDTVQIVPINGDAKVSGRVIEKSDTPNAPTLKVGNGQEGAPGASGGTNASTYQFKVLPQRPIQNGFTVSIEKAQEGIRIPLNTVEEKNGTYFAYIVKNEKAIRKEVQVTKENGQYAVHSGVLNGDVLLVITSDITDGMEVNVNDQSDQTSKH